MPLDKSCSRKAFKANMHTLIKEDGYKNPQAFAIAINTLKDACGVEDKKKQMGVKEILKKKASTAKNSTKSFGGSSSELTLVAVVLSNYQSNKSNKSNKSNN